MNVLAHLSQVLGVCFHVAGDSVPHLFRHFSTDNEVQQPLIPDHLWTGGARLELLLWDGTVSNSKFAAYALYFART
jgi:hypothetical protein